MTYGIMLEATRSWVEQRAAQSNIELEKLGLDAAPPSCGIEGHDDTPESCDCEEVTIPDNLYEVAVIFDGALEEEFLIKTIYEVNIADWIAEQNAFICQLSGKSRDWEVTVTEYAHPENGPGVQRYRVSSDQ